MLDTHRARATLLAFALVASMSACAAIWGFQNGIEQSEAGADAPALDERGSSAADMGGSQFSDESPARDAQVDADATLGADGLDASRHDVEAAADSSLEIGGDSLADAAVDSFSDASTPRDALSDVLEGGLGEDADSALPNGDAGCLAACIPVVPAGWGGPFVIYEGTGGPPPPTLPSCAGSYSVDAYDGTGSPSAPPASCSCSCGAPTNTTCLPPVANYFTDSNCAAGPCGQVNQSIDTNCANLDPCSSGRVTFSAPSPSGGSCAPNAGSSVPPAGWTANVRLCGSSTSLNMSGCALDEVCAPAAGFPFEAATFCVAQSGSVSCPPGYQALRTYYQSSTDTRDCTPCTCGAPTGVTCSSSSIQVYQYAGCFGLNYAVATPQSCLNSGAASAMLTSTSSPSGGMCAPTGGTPTGSFTPTTPTTICCTQ